MWICQVRAVTTRKPFKSCCLCKNPGSFPSSSHLFVCELLGPVTRSRQWKSCVCSPLLRELLASVSIQIARKACEEDVGGLRRVVYCIHLPGDRTQSLDSTSRQKTWTTQSRAAVKLDRYQLWQSSWLPSCFRSAWCGRQLEKKKAHSLGHIKT